MRTIFVLTKAGGDVAAREKNKKMKFEFNHEGIRSALAEACGYTRGGAIILFENGKTGALSYHTDTVRGEQPIAQVKSWLLTDVDADSMVSAIDFIMSNHCSGTDLGFWTTENDDEA